MGNASSSGNTKNFDFTVLRGCAAAKMSAQSKNNVNKGVKLCLEDRK